MQPDSPSTYGVQVLAAATDTLMRGVRKRSYQGTGANLDVLLLTFAMSLWVALLACSGAGAGLIALLLITTGALLLAFVSARNVVAPPPHFYPASPLVVGAVVACGLGVAWRQWQQAGELRLVRDAFGAYVGAEVLAKMGGKMPELGGELRTIAVLFCDIRGYSALAESMRGDPAGLMSELNAHFEPLVGALKQHGAYADNYVGDLVMALFGAPLSQGSVRADAEASVLAALDFVRLVGARNALRAAAGQAPIEVGIGLHCGEAVVGNLGTLGPQSKIHYTAIGDAVNIASRVESTTRKYDVALLVTEEIVQACGEGFKWEFVDETTVKGRVAPVRLYRPAAAANLHQAHREVPL
jgi:adenylate cyclase